MNNVIDYTNTTRRWVEKFVIDLGLCPFAVAPFTTDIIKYALCVDKKPSDILQYIVDETRALVETSSKQISTTLVVVPALDVSFTDYLEVYEMAEQLMETLSFDHHVQLASFHPRYRFEGTTPEDVSNYTNRSPHSIIHLLRVDEMERAIESHPDTAAIPEGNISAMKDLGVIEIEKRMKLLETGNGV